MNVVEERDIGRTVEALDLVRGLHGSIVGRGLLAALPPQIGGKRMVGEVSLCGGKVGAVVGIDEEGKPLVVAEGCFFEGVEEGEDVGRNRILWPKTGRRRRKGILKGPQKRGVRVEGTAAPDETGVLRVHETLKQHMIWKTLLEGVVSEQHRLPVAKRLRLTIKLEIEIWDYGSEIGHSGKER